jgi:hypothetical protein
MYGLCCFHANKFSLITTKVTKRIHLKTDNYHADFFWLLILIELFVLWIVIVYGFCVSDGSGALFRDSITMGSNPK